MDQQDHKVQLVLKVLKAQQEPQVLKEPMVPQDHRVQQDLKEHRVTRVKMVD